MVLSRGPCLPRSRRDTSLSERPALEATSRCVRPSARRRILSGCGFPAIRPTSSFLLSRTYRRTVRRSCASYDITGGPVDAREKTRYPRCDGESDLRRGARQTTHSASSRVLHRAPFDEHAPSNGAHRTVTGALTSTLHPDTQGVLEGEGIRRAARGHDERRLVQRRACPLDCAARDAARVVAVRKRPCAADRTPRTPGVPHQLKESPHGRVAPIRAALPRGAGGGCPVARRTL